MNSQIWPFWDLTDDGREWYALMSFDEEETFHFIALLQTLGIVGLMQDDHGQPYVVIPRR